MFYSRARNFHKFAYISRRKQSSSFSCYNKRVLIRLGCKHLLLRTKLSEVNRKKTVVTNKNWFTVDYCTAFLYCIVFNSSRRLYISSIKSHQAWRLIYSNQKAYVGWDIKNVMSWFLFHILIEKKTKKPSGD